MLMITLLVMNVVCGIVLICSFSYADCNIRATATMRRGSALPGQATEGAIRMMILMLMMMLMLKKMMTMMMLLMTLSSSC